MVVDALTRFRVTWAEVPVSPELVGGDGDTIDNDLILSEGEQYLVLPVTANQYQELLSAALNGANRSFPDDYLNVIWPLIKAGKMLLCESVAECFETSEVFQEALANYLAVNGYGSGSGTPATPSYYTANSDLIDGSLYASCNNNMLFGAITELVDFMNTAITDLLEQFVASTIGPQNTSTLLSAIPIVNQLPFDEMIDFLTQLAYTLKLSYASQYTSVLRDEIRCDLFCMTKDTCALNFQDWADYFAGKAYTSITNVSFVDAIGWFLTGTFAGEAIVWAAHALFAQVLAYGAEWMDIDAAYLTKVITSAMNNPDSDWETLCTDCPPEYPVLIIGDNLTPCELSTEDAGTLTYDGNGYWTLETGPITESIWWGVFQEEGGELFQLQDVTRTSGSLPYRRYCKADGTMTSGAFADPVENTSMSGYRCGLNTGAQIIYTFKAVWP